MKKSITDDGKKTFRRTFFGIAAKVVSIYIKTAEVIATAGRFQISYFASPPVDRYLLDSLAIRDKNWSQLQKDDFLDLIARLKTKCEASHSGCWKLIGT